MVETSVTTDGTSGPNGNNSKTHSNSTPLAINSTQGENIMAEVDTAVLANGHTILANEIAATTNTIKDGQVTLASSIAGVRHDVGQSEANVRDSIGQHSGLINKNIGDNGFRIAAAEANIRSDVGREACGINQNIAAGRAENERGFADTRYNVATEAGALSKQLGAEACGINKHIGDMRQEDAENFGHTRRDIQGTAADIRREQQSGFGETRFNIAERAGDIRREAAEHTNEIVKEGLKGDFNTRGDIKDTRFDLASRIGDQADRLQNHAEAGFDRTVDRINEFRTQVNDRFFTVGRDLMDLRQGQATLAKDVELNALKTQLDAKENTRYLSDKIAADGEKTRALINDLKYHDLNRGLVERNTELVNCEQDRRHYHDRYHDARWEMNQAQFAGQWAQLQSQIQAFQSQLQETRQGMVNFGTMAGVGQSSTSNNVR